MNEIGVVVAAQAMELR